MLPIAHIEKDCWLRWRVTKCFAVVLVIRYQKIVKGERRFNEEL